MTNYKKIILESNVSEIYLLRDCVANNIKDLEKSPDPIVQNIVRRMKKTEKKLHNLYWEAVK